ncbi:MAG: hypothetical protein GY898_00125 [Proteobacteria bacterium]|nr:hypothetical protein [Pseudomonadota bacterium]
MEHSTEEDELTSGTEEISGVMLIDVEPAAPSGGITWSSPTHRKPVVDVESLDAPCEVAPPSFGSLPGAEVPARGFGAWMKRVKSWFTPDRGVGFLDDGFDNLAAPVEVAPPEELLLFADPNSGDQPVLRV